MSVTATRAEQGRAADRRQRAVGSPRAARHRSARTSPPLFLLRLVTAAVTALVMADTVATTLALSVLGTDPIAADVAVDQLSLVSTINLAAVAALLATAGRLADLLGRRAVLAAGLATFAIGALAVAWASSWSIVLAGRLAQGAGAAVMMPAALGLLLSRVSEHQRRGALALWGAATGGGAVVMHALGGLVLTGYGWRVLYLPSGMIAIGLLLLTAAVPRLRGTQQQLPDLLGVVLLITATTSAVVVISQGGRWGWTSPRTLIGVGVVLAASSLVMVRSRRHPAGAIDLALWRHSGFGWGALTSLLYGLMAFPVLVMTPLALRAHGFSPAAVGLALLPMSLATMLISPLASALTRRMGTSWVICAGAYASAVGALMLLADPTPSLSGLVGLVVLGAGFGVVNTTATIAGTLRVASDRYAAAVGSIITARTLGGALGPAIATAYIAHVPEPAGGRQGVLAGCMIVALVLTACALVRALRQARRRSSCDGDQMRPVSPAAVPGRTAAAEELELLRALLSRQRARFEAIAAAAEAELLALTDPNRVHPSIARRPEHSALPHSVPVMTLPEVIHDRDTVAYPLPRAVSEPGAHRRRSA